ncbi:hypothetical protein QBZ16_002998 [Prototheca wickerhamii]|uniref:Uncharacterized protein n=1 Tax=Prototheca wickerhamii TaxID=3111 RepID=A0AAD9MJ44_PROWI|nr:hypothetical protein QBZ16_002998 [Prototheca wickerhamii]
MAAWRIFFPERPNDSTPKEEGKNRLRMILVADRCGITPASLSHMRESIVKAVSDYVDIETEEEIEVNLSTDPELGTIYSVAGWDPENPSSDASDQFPYGDSASRINSIDFHRTHDLLVTGGDDDAIRLYNTESGTAQQALLSKKYGVKSVCFTHDPSSVIYSSNKGADYALRYHDLHSNRYIRYFRGHQAKVTTLCMSPKSDAFLSAAEDKQVRLWDLRQPYCQALLQTPGLPTVTYDEQGLVFCVGAESGVVKLYDARNYQQGPFSAFVVADEKNSAAVFAQLRFSLDGKFLLAVVEGRIYVLDAFEGTIERKVTSDIPEGGQALGGLSHS